MFSSVKLCAQYSRILSAHGVFSADLLSTGSSASPALWVGVSHALAGCLGYPGVLDVVVDFILGVGSIDQRKKLLASWLQNDCFSRVSDL